MTDRTEYIRSERISNKTPHGDAIDGRASHAASNRIKRTGGVGRSPFGTISNKRSDNGAWDMGIPRRVRARILHIRASYGRDGCQIRVGGINS